MIFNFSQFGISILAPESTEDELVIGVGRKKYASRITPDMVTSLSTGAPIPVGLHLNSSLSINETFTILRPKINYDELVLKIARRNPRAGSGTHQSASTELQNEAALYSYLSPRARGFFSRFYGLSDCGGAALLEKAIPVDVFYADYMVSERVYDIIVEAYRSIFEKILRVPDFHSGNIGIRPDSSPVLLDYALDRETSLQRAAEINALFDAVDIIKEAGHPARRGFIHRVMTLDEMRNLKT